MRINDVQVKDGNLCLELDNYQVVKVPLRLYPRLSYARNDELDNWRLIAGGTGIHWPDLDEDISLQNILAGRGSCESRRSFQNWLRERNQLSLGV